MRIVFLALGVLFGSILTQHYFLREMDPEAIQKGLVATAENSHRTGCLRAVKKIKGELTPSDSQDCRKEARRYAEELARSIGG